MVKANGAGRLDFKVLIESSLIDQVLKYAVGGGRAADIAHAEKEDAFHLELNHGGHEVWELGNGFTIKFTKHTKSKSGA